MKERCSRDQEMSHSFAVDWLKVVHMPFMVFDRIGKRKSFLLFLERPIKLDKMEDGTELDAINGGELFEWMWRHPNVFLLDLFYM